MVLWVSFCAGSVCDFPVVLHFQHRSKHLKGPAWRGGLILAPCLSECSPLQQGGHCRQRRSSYPGKEAEESALKTGTALNSLLPPARPHSLQTSTTSWGPRVQTQSNHNARQERAGPWRAVTFPYGCIIPGLKTTSLSPEVLQSRCGHR